MYYILSIYIYIYISVYDNITTGCLVLASLSHKSCNACGRPGNRSGGMKGASPCSMAVTFERNRQVGISIQGPNHRWAAKSSTHLGVRWKPRKTGCAWSDSPRKACSASTQVEFLERDTPWVEKPTLGSQNWWFWTLPPNCKLVADPRQGSIVVSFKGIGSFSETPRSKSQGRKKPLRRSAAWPR